MSTLLDTADTARFQDGEMVIIMKSGTELRFPVAKNPGSPAVLMIQGTELPIPDFYIFK